MVAFTLYNNPVVSTITDTAEASVRAAAVENGAPTEFPMTPDGDSAATSREPGETAPAEGELKRRTLGAKLVSFVKRLRYGKPPHPDREIRHIENQEEMIKWLRINAKLLTPVHSFYRGIALGLGIVVGTGIVLSLLIHLFAKLALVPLFGDFARQILNYLEATNGAH